MRGILRILWKTLVWAWIWIKRPKNFITCFFSALALPGYLDGFSTWLIWINKVIALLPEESAKEVADFLASEWARWGALSLALFIFKIDKIRFCIQWVLGRAEYAVAFVTDEQHFIPLNDALRVVKRSDWARARRMQAGPSMTLYEQIQKTIAVTDPAEAARIKKFDDWCGLVLDNFETLFEKSTRVIDGNKEYDEGTLRNWLKIRYEEDLTQEFGEP